MDTIGRLRALRDKVQTGGHQVAQPGYAGQIIDDLLAILTDEPTADEAAVQAAIDADEQRAADDPQF